MFRLDEQLQIQSYLLETFSQMTLVLRMTELQDVFPQQILQDRVTEG